VATRFSTSVDGTRIAYDVTGSGPALMLLHGAGKTRRDWHTLGYVERLKIEQFLTKWEDVILAAREGAALQSKGKIKGQIPALAACFQAMRDWPSVEPGEIGCPVLLLTGTKNASTLGWVEANRGALDAAGAQIKVVEGLTHDQEFVKIDRVFPVVSAFFRSRS
jgi:pimeloyl-ACP methyl ester carboxylesterase